MKNSRPGSTPFGTLFDLPKKKTQLKEIESQMAKPGFWDSPDTQSVVAGLKALKSIIDPMEAVLAQAEDLAVLADLAESEDDAEARSQVETERLVLIKEVAKVSLLALLSGPNDARDCYFNIQAGAGGTEACDWADMLLRMYLRYFEAWNTSASGPRCTSVTPV